MTTQLSVCGGEKARYLRQLDAALSTLIAGLSVEKNEYQRQQLAQYGVDHDWQTDRLPQFDATYATLAQFAGRVRDEYAWLSDVTGTDPLKNRGWFERIRVSPESGMPDAFNFIELHKLRKEHAALRKALPTYPGCARDLSHLLLEDNVPLDEVPAKAQDIRRMALKRSFLDQIAVARLIDWKADAPAAFAAKRVMPLGGEDLWNISGVKYLPAAGMFEAYIIDAWQDNREPQIARADGKEEGTLSPALQQSFVFGAANAPWYVLKSIDEKFESLHPVHVTRALIGPLECKYRTMPGFIAPLPIISELLAQDKDAALLRFSRKYAYAPNHEVRDDKFRQVVHTDDWSDEVIVAPAKYAPAVSQSVLGTAVRVFESSEVA